MEIKLFDKTMIINDYYCQLNGNSPSKIEEPYINLYIRSKGCNANCKFCEYKDSAKDFHLTRYLTFLKKLSDSKIEVRKISFTGGEPTLYYTSFIQNVKTAKSYFPNAFIVVNTNGYNLERLILSGDYLLFDSIALSRHSIFLNNWIFNDPSNYITNEKLKSLIYTVNNPKIFHFSCNIIKNHIDNPDAIYEYLDWCSEIGITDVGFVSLMPINEYAKKHYVDFSSLNVESKRFIKVKSWNKGENCKCNNYLYIADNLTIINVYNRQVCSESNDGNNFVFDGQNLHRGFNGELIY